MISYKNVSAEYEKGHIVLNDISFTIEKGDRVGLIGANGAGKSTLMKTLLVLLPYTGTIEVEGIAVNKANTAAIRKMIGFVLQNSDNQMFMPTVYDDMIFGPMNYGLSKEEAEKKIDEVLDSLHISDLKHKYNHKISGGEKRMAAIATVLAMEPDVIVMDEPSASLDPYNRRMVINAIKKLPQTCLIASHDLDMIWESCNKVLLISDGQIKALGSTKTILTNRTLLEENRLELPFCLAGHILAD